MVDMLKLFVYVIFGYVQHEHQCVLTGFLHDLHFFRMQKIAAGMA